MILQSDWSLPHNRDKLCFNLYVKLFLSWAAHTVQARDELRGEYEGYSDSASTQHILIDILLSIHAFISSICSIQYFARGTSECSCC